MNEKGEPPLMTATEELQQLQTAATETQNLWFRRAHEGCSLRDRMLLGAHAIRRTEDAELFHTLSRRARQ